MSQQGTHPTWPRFVRARPHLVMAVLFGTAVAVLMPGSRSWLHRALMGWNSGVWIYLATMGWLMARADHLQVRAIACKQDEKARAVLCVMLAGTAFSLYAIVTELANSGKVAPDQAVLQYAYTILTVTGSWLLVGVLFALHYAHLYYAGDQDASGPPLGFPGGEREPNYWDFLYFSFTISVAVQTSDVSVASRPMRKLVLGHSVLAFFFNLLILGLSVNIAASVVNT